MNQDIKCPNREHMGAHACDDKSQCWEPCGGLGKCAESARAATVDMAHFEEIGSVCIEDGKMGDTQFKADAKLPDGLYTIFAVQTMFIKKVN